MVRTHMCGRMGRPCVLNFLSFSMLTTLFAVIAVFAVSQPSGDLDSHASKFARSGDRLRAPELSPGERVRLMDDMIVTGRRLVSEGESDPRWPTWAADLAGLLLRRLSLDAADSTVLLGLPSADQRSRVEAATREAATLLNRLGGRIADQPEGDEFRVRHHVMHARVTALRNAVQGGRMIHSAATPELAPGPGKAAHDVTRAVLLLQTSSDQNAIEAVQILTGVLKSAEGSLPHTRAEAVAAQIRGTMMLDASRRHALRNARTSIEAMREAPSDERFAHAAMITEAIARAYLDIPSELGLGERIALACEAMTELMRDVVSPDVARTWAVEKLSWRADETWSDGDAPLLAVLAASRSLERAGRRLEAIELLENAAKHLKSRERREAMLTRLRLLFIESEDSRNLPLVASAADLGLDILREFPDATGHIEPCLIIAKNLAAQAQARESDKVRYAAWLDVALAHPGVLGELDYWKLQRGEFRASAATTTTELLRALDDFASVEAASAIRPFAAEQFREAALKAVAGIRARIDALRLEGKEEQIAALAKEEWVPLASSMARWPESAGDDRAHDFALAVADAYTEAGSPDGEHTYRRLLVDADPASPHTQDVALNLARALAHAGKHDQAFALLRQVATDSDAPTTDGQARPTRFWHAWTLLLEATLDQPRNPRRDTSIRTHLVRLQTIDPNLGGQPWKSRLERIQDALSR